MNIALITGGSSGLGGALVKEFKRNGWQVINASRRPTPEADYNIAVDFSNPNSSELLLAELIELNLEPNLLINNAGIGAYGTYEELQVSEIRQLMELDYFAPVTLTKTLLPMIEKNHGSIINIASMAAKIHVPAMGSYCSAKSAFALFSETLRAELHQRVRVMTVYPGRVNTGFSSRALKYREVPSTPDNSNVLPEDFAKSVYRCFKKNKKRCYFPGFYPFGTVLVKLFAERYDERLNRRLWKI